VSGLISRITATCLLLSNSSSRSSIEFPPGDFQMHCGQKSVLSNKVTLGCQGNWRQIAWASRQMRASLRLCSILPTFRGLKSFQPLPAKSRIRGRILNPLRHGWTYSSMTARRSTQR
jgi:hypothetical protein